MSMTINKTTKVVRLGPFVIEPTFISKSGTGQRCQTAQGWHLRLWDSAPLSNGDRHDWNLSRKEAIAQAEKWFADAHTNNVDDVANHNLRYLQWLVRVWPEATVAQRALALATKRQNDALAANQRQQEEFVRSVNRAKECAEFCASHPDLKGHVIVRQEALEGMVKVLLQVVHDGPRVTEPMVRIHVEKARLALEALGIERVREIQTALNAGDGQGWVAVV